MEISNDERNLLIRAAHSVAKKHGVKLPRGLEKVPLPTRLKFYQTSIPGCRVSSGDGGFNDLLQPLAEANGGLLEHRHVDPRSGQISYRYYGDPMACWAPFHRPARKLQRIKTPSDFAREQRIRDEKAVLASYHRGEIALPDGPSK